MEANTWFPKEVDTTKDALDYRCNLTAGEKECMIWFGVSLFLWIVFKPII